MIKLVPVDALVILAAAAKVWNDETSTVIAAYVGEGFEVIKVRNDMYPDPKHLVIVEFEDGAHYHVYAPAELKSSRKPVKRAIEAHARREDPEEILEVL